MKEMKETLEEALKATAEKAAQTKSADEALKFSQAALNAAHGLATLANIK